MRTLFYVMWPECLNSGLRIGKNLGPDKAGRDFPKSAPVVPDTDPRSDSRILGSPDAVISRDSAVLGLRVQEPKLLY